jgi:hypothetical protein
MECLLTMWHRRRAHLPGLHLLYRRSLRLIVHPLLLEQCQRPEGLWMLLVLLHRLYLRQNPTRMTITTRTSPTDIQHHNMHLQCLSAEHLTLPCSSLPEKKLKRTIFTEQRFNKRAFYRLLPKDRHHHLLHKRSRLTTTNLPTLLLL